MLSKFKTHEEIKKTRTFRMPITNIKKKNILNIISYLELSVKT